MSLSVNPALSAEFHRSSGGQKALLEAAEAIAENARGLAPVRTGDYRDSITVEQDRKGTRVVAADFKAGWIEFGTGGDTPTPAHAPLRKGAEQAGLTLTARWA